MIKHSPRNERLAYIERFRADAQAFPGHCFICRKPTTERHQVRFVDFLGGADEMDAEFEVPMCESCLRAGRMATEAIVTIRARRS